MDADVGVVIVGAGPVGLMLACELALQGVDTAVIESLPAPSDESRAQALHGRTIPTLERRGLLDRFVAAETQLNGGSTDSHAKRPLPKGHFAGIPGLRFTDPDVTGPRVAFVPQARTTELLAERAAELGVTVHRGCTVIDVESDEDGVNLIIEGAVCPRLVRAEYVVGCDGGRSVVRKVAGIGFPGTDASLETVAGDVHLDEPDGLPRGWHRTPRGCTVLGIHPAGGRSRVVAIEFTESGIDKNEPVELAELAERTSRILGRPVPMSDLGVSQRYSDAARLADRYRAGRILLAGDSAHIHYPVGGQGLNIGLQDAVNLGWKLAGTIAGWAPKELLDSYELERHPVAEAVLEYTQAQIALLNPDPRMDPLRAVFAKLIEIDEVDQFFSRRGSCADVRYPAGYPDAHPLAGSFAPDLLLQADSATGEGSTVRLAATLSAGRPVLLGFDPDRPLTHLAAGWSDRVNRHEFSCPARPELAGLLIRPDGYLAWVAEHDEPWERVAEGLDTALRTWFGDPVERHRTPVAAGLQSAFH